MDFGDFWAIKSKFKTNYEDISVLERIEQGLTNHKLGNKKKRFLLW